MYRPNNKCRIQLATGASNLYGQSKPGAWVTESCTVVRMRLTTRKTSVRADSSATRGAAREEEAQVVILLSPTTAASIDDIVEIEAQRLRIIGKEPRFATSGRLDHYEVTLDAWKAAS